MQTLNHYVGYSRESECWFVRFYPYQTEQQAKDAVSAFTRPAAPVEGLETVGYRYRHVDYVNWTYSESKYPRPDIRNEELVTRSQAEAIIAAKDDLIDKYKWQVRDTCVRAEKAEADNAALTARVKELEGDWTETVKTIRSLETQISAYRSALTYIASFTQTTDLLWWQKHARAALEAKP